MAEIGDLGDEFIGQNQGAYDGLAHLAEHAATASCPRSRNASPSRRRFPCEPWGRLVASAPVWMESGCSSRAQ
jgi:hypothetical protein